MTVSCACALGAVAFVALPSPWSLGAVPAVGVAFLLLVSEARAERRQGL